MARRAAWSFSTRRVFTSTGSRTTSERRREKGMIAVKTPILFKPGKVVATPGALEALEQAGQSVWEFVTRHIAGDWGVVNAGDKTANDESLKDGSRLLSAYLLSTGKK